LTVRSNLNLSETIEGRSAFTLRNNTMKEKIHPKFFEDAQVVCSCGNTFTIGSTKKSLRVELCSKCHPFFTGERRMMDTAGRVEKFKQRYKLAK
jgi:large subunit ribosomal protein L31